MRTYELNFELNSERWGVRARVRPVNLLAHLFRTRNVWVRTQDGNRHIVRFVTDLPLEEVKQAVEVLSDALYQDCIALALITESKTIRDEIEQGWLLGPYAEEWGEFDPDYFERFTN